MITIALAGNPNSGKTTLFNRLTGTRQTTGNWPGVTVEKKVGTIRYHKDVLTLVDLPGIYSLSPYSLEEIVTRNFILEEKPDVVINIIDATNLERNLYLSLQLKKLGRPMIVALNMMDEIISHGDHLDTEAMSHLLGLPVIPISAKKNEGMEQLLNAVRTAAAYNDESNAQAIDSSNSTESDKGLKTAHHSHENAIHPVHPQDPVHEHPHHHEGGRTHSHPHVIGHHISLTERTYQPETDEETAELYRQAAEIQKRVLIHSHPPDAMTRSDRIDRILTNRWLAIPIFLLVMFLVFQVTFSENLGGRLTEWLDVFFQQIIGGAVRRGLVLSGAPVWIESLLVGGVIAGVGGVLTFLPQISLLFIFLTLLEDTGYMARAAFIIDRLFQGLGLSGRSFIPMLMGFGCTVPAVMAARTLDNERERRLTILITPFMSCGAKMPIYAFFASIFFSRHKGLVTFSMYLLGVTVAVLSALIISRIGRKKHQNTSFLIELPPYRLPDRKSLFLHVWDKIRDFLIRAGTLIFAMTIVVWFFQSFSFAFKPVTDNAQSIFGVLGGWIAPLLAPLGFGNWQSAVALLTGLIAKETVVASIGILFTGEQISQLFHPLSAYAFMTFTLLYTPCVAALGAIRREMNSWKWTLAAIGWQTGAAWLASFLIFQIGRLVLQGVLV